MANLRERARELLGLQPGVILTDEEIANAIAKAPKAERSEMQLAEIRDRTEREKTIAEVNQSTGSAAGLQVPGDRTGTA